MMKNKLGKRFLVGVLSLAVAVLGFTYMPDKVQAEETSPVKYQKVANADFKMKVGKTAPVYIPEDATDNTGYLFAGWYEIGENDAVGDSIASEDGITAEYVYAKFVPSYLTGIACQVDLNTNADKRNMRVVSLVDSDDYTAVGFNVYGRYDTNNDGSNETEWEMYRYSEDPENPNKAQSTDIYSGLYQYTEKDGTMTKEIKYPKDVFGTAAEGFFFTTVSIAGITSDFFDATMAVKPYWITLDGIYVEGMGEFNRINDYEDKIVNVSVNLKEATAIAAGMLNITVPDGFAYTSVEVEDGRVFEEMESTVSGTTIKCVGNVSGIADSAKVNEVYVNLRFQVNSLPEKGATEFIVNVPVNSFCSIDEEFNNDVEAWNVKY